MRLLFAGKIKLVCLLAGLLTLGEIGMHTATCPQEAVLEAVTEEEDEEAAEEINETDGQIDRMKAEYGKLEEEEASIRELLQEKEEELKEGRAVEQTEIMELNEKLRTVQLQKLVMNARIEEKTFDK